MLIKNLYEQLFIGEKTSELSFYKISNSFNPRKHPDFKSGVSDDY